MPCLRAAFASSKWRSTSLATSRRLLICATLRAADYPSALRASRALQVKVDQMTENSNNIIPLKGLKVHQFRRKFRLRKAGQITALDLDGSMLRVAQAEMRGDQALVTRIGAAPLALAPDADRSDPVVL